MPEASSLMLMRGGSTGQVEMLTEVLYEETVIDRWKRYCA